jgi:hypothetical protein
MRPVADEIADVYSLGHRKRGKGAVGLRGTATR